MLLMKPVPMALGILATGLFVGWILQFATLVFDHHPTWAIAWAGLCALGASVAAFVARREGIPRSLAVVPASLVIVGAGCVVWLKAAHLDTTRPLPDYSLPRQAIAYELPVRELRLTTSDGVRLKATLIPSKRKKGVVIYPGWHATRHSFGPATLAQWLSPEFIVLVLDPRGQGESAGHQHPGRAKYDIHAAVTALKGEGAELVGVLAEAEGTYAAAMAATDKKGIASVVLTGPVSRWGPPNRSFSTEPGNPLGGLYWRLTAGLRVTGGPSVPMAELLSKIPGVPVLLMGSKDQPGSPLLELYKRTPEPRSMRVFPGSAAPVGWAHFNDYGQTVAQWFELTLRAP